MDTILQALDALRQHTFRSILTLTGITWGIVAVTVLNSYGDGFGRTILRAFESFGPDVAVVWPGQTSEQAGGERAGRRVLLEIEDVERIQGECPLVKAASPEFVRHTAIATDTRTTTTAVRGVWPAYSHLRNEYPVSGRFVNDDDLRERRRVAFLGNNIKMKLFSGVDPVGQTLLIRGMRFTVVGWMEKKVQFGSYFRPDDDSVWVPYTTSGDLWDNKYLSTIVFAPVAPEASNAAMEQVRAVIARAHRFSPRDKRALIVFSREQIRPIIESITIGLQSLLVFIGTLTLGIGGIGVMNIMLVSVTERTREIGVRMALGATRHRILLQFLSEALALTAVGGALGILIAVVLVPAIGTVPLMGQLFEDTSGKGDIQMQLSSSTIAISTLVLMLVGVTSGFFPALKASRMNPVEALRYE